RHLGNENQEDQRLNAVMTQGQSIYVGGSDYGMNLYAPSVVLKQSMMWISLDKGQTWTRYTDMLPENQDAFAGKHEIYTLQTLSSAQTFGFGELAAGR